MPAARPEEGLPEVRSSASVLERVRNWQAVDRGLVVVVEHPEGVGVPPWAQLDQRDASGRPVLLGGGGEVGVVTHRRCRCPRIVGRRRRPDAREICACRHRRRVEGVAQRPVATSHGIAPSRATSLSSPRRPYPPKQPLPPKPAHRKRELKPVEPKSIMRCRFGAGDGRVTPAATAPVTAPATAPARLPARSAFRRPAPNPPLPGAGSRASGLTAHGSPTIERIGRSPGVGADGAAAQVEVLLPERPDRSPWPGPWSRSPTRTDRVDAVDMLRDGPGAPWSGRAGAR